MKVLNYTIFHTASGLCVMAMLRVSSFSTPPPNQPTDRHSSWSHSRGVVPVPPFEKQRTRCSTAGAPAEADPVDDVRIKIKRNK